MSEVSVFSNRAVVYYFDSAKKTWAPSPVAAYTRLDIYKNTGNGACRVIGRGMEDPTQVVINSSLTKDTAYVRTRDQFHQFQDPRYLYGLSFGTPADAEAFAAAFEKEVASLKGGAAPPPAAAKPAAPAPVAPKMAPVVAPAKPAAPAPPIASKPAGGPPPPPAKGPPPPAPKKAAAAAPSYDEPPSSDEPGRNALLDSIQGFSKNKLKKAETVDKSGPILPASKPAAESDGGGGGGGGGAARAGGAPKAMGGGNDMMGAILQKRAAMQKQNSSPSVQAPHQPAVPEPKKAPPPTPAAAKTGTLPRTENKPTTPVASKPKPPPPRNAAPLDLADSESAPASSSGGELPAHLQTLKEEILQEVRNELAAMKEEILNAIYNRG